MKKFLSKITTLVILLVFLTVSIVIFTYTERESILSYRIPADRHIVFVGNSQFEMGIDDRKIPGTINLAKSGKQYLFMRVDVENLLQDNPQIDTVFLVVSPFSIRESDADRSYYDESYIRSVTYYAPYLTLNDYKTLPNSILMAKDYLFGGCLKYIVSHETVGKYIYNTRDDMKADLQKNGAQNGNFQKDDAGNSITVVQIEQIEQVCKEYGAELILMATPNYKAEDVYDIPLFRKQVLEMQQKYSIDFWDYSCYHLDDSCYSDMTHLNYRGAALFTEILKKKLIK